MLCIYSRTAESEREGRKQKSPRRVKSNEELDYKVGFDF